MEDDLRPAREEESPPARFSSPFDAEHEDMHAEERLEFLSCDPFASSDPGDDEEPA